MGKSNDSRNEYIYERQSDINQLKRKIKKIEADITMIMEMLKTIKNK